MDRKEIDARRAVIDEKLDEAERVLREIETLLQVNASQISREHVAKPPKYWS